MVTLVYRSCYDARFTIRSPKCWSPDIPGGCPTAPNLFVELYKGEPEIVGHPAVAVLLGLGDPLLVGGARLVIAPELREHVPKARVSVPLVVGVDGQVAFQDRRLVLTAPGLLVFIGQGQQPRRIIGIICQHPLEIIYPVCHENPPVVTSASI